MRTMYDSITPGNIPADAQMVAGYIDKGPAYGADPWTDEDFARFPSAVHVRIATQAGTNAGDVLDVEPGDATIGQAVQWVQMRRAAGAHPSVYCSESTWAQLRAAFHSADEPEPEWWIAAYPGIGQVLYPGTVAHQWGGDIDGGYDISVVADYWPGVDPTPSTMEEDSEMIARCDDGGSRSGYTFFFGEFKLNGVPTDKVPANVLAYACTLTSEQIDAEVEARAELVASLSPKPSSSGSDTGSSSPAGIAPAPEKSPKGH